MLVNRIINRRRILWTLLPCAIVLSLAAGLRGAEYDEQYTLFLTSGVPRPAWPATVFPAGLASEIQSGHSGLAAVARDLRVTDVHPPLYFWLVLLWRDVLGHGLFVARLLSVLLGLGALALTGVIARTVRVPAVWAMLLTLGCYGFAYTSVVARGFALAQVLLLGGVLGLLTGRRWWHFALAGALFGAATLTNYLSVFVAGACLVAAFLEVFRPPWNAGSGDPHRSGQGDSRPGRGHDDNPTGRWHDDRTPSSQDPSVGTLPGPFVETPAHTSVATLPGPDRATSSGPGHDTWPRASALPRALSALLGFLLFIPADLWWFLRQRGSRPGQFLPFSLSQSLARLAVRFTGDILGGLPLYVGGIASSIVSGVLGLLLLALIASIVWRWRRIAIPSARIMFAFAAVAPALGLLVLGYIFNNTPIEVRYLTFSTPFAGLLLAGALSVRGFVILLGVQAASIAGLMLAPQTMQPARATAHAAAALVRDGVVLLPRGNDGVGVVGAFAIEAPPALPLLLIPAEATPGQIRARIGAFDRVVLALLEQDDASRAASDAMRQAMTVDGWREVAQGPNVAVYERIDAEE